MEEKQIKNKNHKHQKSFYTALSISIFMVIAACAYSYVQSDDNNQKTAENSLKSEELDVNREQDNVLKIVTTESLESETEAEFFEETADLESEIYEESESEISVIKSHNYQAETEAELGEENAVLEFETEEITSHILNYPIDTDNADIEVIMPFSNGELIKFETTGCWQTHNGTDFKASKGDDIYACESGIVTSVSEDGLWGITIEIDHENGVVSRYCGMGSELLVAENDIVTSGQKIGVLSDNPEIEENLESHFHFEIIKDGNYIDPQEYLK
jgi:murein DD-endopeptidase MepM/ murein hydrolase activator NlpD